MKTEESLPVDRGWAWIILLGNFMVVFLVIGCTSSFGLFFAEFMVEFRAPASSITIALSVQTIVFSVSSLFALNIGSSLASNRTYIILGGLFGCSAYLISAVIKDISYLILSHGVIFGIAYGFSYGPALVVLGRYFDQKRGIASSLGNMGVSVGSLVFPPVIRLLLDSYGLRGALAVIGGILLNLCVAGALMRPVTFYQDKTDKIDHGQKVWATNSDVYDSNKVKIPSNDEKENHIIKADPINYYNLSNVVKNSDIIQTSSTQKQKLQGLDKRIQTTKHLCKKVVHFKVLKNALFRMWIPVCFLGIIGCVQIVIFIPPHAKDLQISDSDITLLVIIVGASNFISKILLAYFIYINLMPKHILIALSLIITGISCMFISFYTNFVTMTILSVIFGVFGSVYFGLFPAVLVDFVGLEHLSGAMAINMLMQGLGLSISNPILGFLRDMTGSFHASFYLMGTTLIISGAILFLEPLCRRMEIRRTAAQYLQTQIDIQPL